MDNKEIKPTLDLEFLQKKANEYAMKGAEETLKDFYSGYNSPYKKAIEENLKNKAVDNNFDLPDILAVLNEKISIEIDKIANTAVTKTFIPLVKKLLIREESEIKFSDILKNFIESTDFNHDDDDVGDYIVEKIERDGYSNSTRDTFPVYTITNGKTGYELHFYNNGEKITLISLPYVLNDNNNYYTRHSFSSKQTMKVTVDNNKTIELPYVSNILDDDFMSFCARLVIGNNEIIFDCKNFDEDMFPEKECHC